MDTRAEAVVDVLLRHGQVAQLRAVEPDDAPAIEALNARLSLRSRESRYFTASDRAPHWYVDRLMRQQDAGAALLALVDDEVVAVASFSRLERDPGKAEFALLVDDVHQHEGLGALLLEQLARLATEAGVTTFVADVLASNHTMHQLLEESGFAVREISWAAGVTEVEVELTDTAALRAAISAREEVAEVASLRRVLAPARVAVVGSSRPGTVGRAVHEAVVAGGFTGRVDVVGRGDSVPDGVDLVVVAVPAEAVAAVVEQAARAGAGGLVVLSAGFAEAAGKDRQAELLDLVRRKGMRLVGPNCLGLVNTDPLVRLNATFCDAQARAGGIALVSQSGAVGIAALRHAERRGAGLSLFVSLGNKADVSGNDLLAHLAQDPRTRVVALYLESFGNPAKFVRLARDVGRTKPVVVLKSGWSAAGARAGMSHTAAALTSDSALDAVMHEAGVLRVRDLPELFDVLTILDAVPVPGGKRVAIIGNSGGPGVLATDACAAAGLSLAELSAGTTKRLREILPDSPVVSCPVDLLASASPETVEDAVAAVLADPGVDVAVAICTPIAGPSEAAFARALARAASRAPGTPLLATMPGVASAPEELSDGSGQVPFFEFPETAVRALGRVVQHALRPLPSLGLVPEEHTAGPGVAMARRRLDLDSGQRGWVDTESVMSLLGDYGVASPAGAVAADAASAVAAAEDLGYPVVVKGQGADLVHKTDSGAVLLDLRDAQQVREGIHDLQRRLGPRLSGFLVQEMVVEPSSLELLAGLVVEESVGPLVVVAAGGIHTELLADRCVRLPPRSLAAAREQVLQLRCAPRLLGHRGQPALDVTAVCRVLLALTDLARDVPEVQELDINPLVVTPRGAWCLDARLRTGPALAVPDPLARALSPRLPAPREPQR